MHKKEISKYTKLNSIAESFGTVILGSGDDTQIPISELTDAFKINSKFYNRSAEKLSIKDSIDYYDTVVSALNPERIILHIGACDIDFFKNDQTDFDIAYSKLITHIRKDNKSCNIGIVSLSNIKSDPTVNELNSHLRMIAQSEHCEFEDISLPRVWNPIETKNALSFASAMGLSKKLNSNRSLYDLAKIFFSLNLNCVG